MSRPRFPADHDLNEHIVDGILRQEPAVEFVRVRDVGMHERPDPENLEFAAGHELITVSHDVNTMPGHPYTRIADGKGMASLDGAPNRADRARHREPGLDLVGYRFGGMARSRLLPTSVMR